jgi:hypothetical protein
MDKFIQKEGKIQCFMEEGTPPPKKKRAQLHEEDALERFYELVISSPD